MYLSEDKKEGLTESILKKITVSVKGKGLNITDIKGKRVYEDDGFSDPVYLKMYGFDIPLGRAAKWKETIDVSFNIGNSSFTDQFYATKEITKKIKVSVKNFTYDGKKHAPSVKVTLDGKTLKEGVDYKIYCYENKVNVGKKYFHIYEVYGSPYSVANEASYKINPKGTSLRSLTASRKALTVKWKKQAEKMKRSVITGYQIQLATDKAFKKNVVSEKVKGYKTVSKKVTDLKAKTTYYVRIRTYKTVNGNTCYSAWSDVKKKKTN